MNLIDEILLNRKIKRKEMSKNEIQNRQSICVVDMMKEKGGGVGLGYGTV